jgi:hypothetical protein
MDNTNTNVDIKKLCENFDEMYKYSLLLRQKQQKVNNLENKSVDNNEMFNYNLSTAQKPNISYREWIDTSQTDFFKGKSQPLDISWLYSKSTKNKIETQCKPEEI